MTVSITRMLPIAVVSLHLLFGQAGAPSPENPQWRALAFLEGTWEAKTRPTASGIQATGTYTFRKELGGHVLARYSSTLMSG